MKKIVLWGGVAVAPLLFFVMVHAASAPALSNEELAAIVRPAVVRVVQVDKGTSTIPAFDIDFKTLSIIPNPKAKPYVVSLDATVLGSGFVVNPDGYVLTNSHVVSPRSAELEAAGRILQNILLKDLVKLSPDETDAINTALQQAATSTKGMTTVGEELGKKALDYIFAKGTFNVSTTVTVLNPSSTPGLIDDLIKRGFTANVLHVNDDFWKDQKDIALLKIGESDLPSVTLGDSSGVALGGALHILGFPGTAQIGTTDYLQSNFTEGIVSAIKSSDDGTFRIIQTDAKVSSGSSGSPLILPDGSVAGVITFESDLSSSSNGAGSGPAGDNFASAVPIELAKAVLAAAHVENVPGAYATHLAKGLALMHADECKAALGEFSAAAATNPKFLASSYTAGFASECAALVRSGGSIDSAWDRFRAAAIEAGPIVWALAIVSLAVIAVLVFFIVRLQRKARNDERAIADLERTVAGERAKQEESDTIKG